MNGAKGKTVRWLLTAVLVAAGLSTASPAAATLLSQLEQISPNPTFYTFGIDQSTFADNGNAATGDVLALLEAVDIGPTSGCEAADFAGFTAGHIALMERGTCVFSNKVNNADAAGAVGAIIFNNALGLFVGQLVDPTGIPAVSTSNAVGLDLVNLLSQGNVTVHLAVFGVPEPTTVLLLGSGVAGLAGLGWRRARRT